MKRRWWMPVVFSFLGLLGLPAASTLGAVSGGAYMIGDKVESLSVQDLQGKPVKLSDFKGKVVLVNFFASW
jgi:cytochrome oxidase Cu insertion factor (SCO1/SenC/PrrC family)